MKPDWSHLARPAVVKPRENAWSELAPALVKARIARLDAAFERPVRRVLEGDPDEVAEAVRAQLAAMHGFVVEGYAPSTPNLREHHMVLARRVAKVRRQVDAAMRPWLTLHPIGPLLVVTLTRVSPRSLDAHDNLRAALKPHVDAVAKRLRIDDASPLVEWRYEQRKGPPAVEFNIETRMRT